MSTILCEYVSDLKKYNLQFIASNSKDCFSSSFIIKPPTDFEYIPVSIYDGFVFAVIFKAMEVGEDFIVELPLSIDGVRNIHYFIEAWANLCPHKYKKIHFIATNIVSLNNKLPSSEAIVAFSGGVDSCFTLIRHNEKDWQHNDTFSLKHVLCIQGFDVPTDKSNEYAKLMERISPIYEQFGCKRFEVWTDLKKKSQQDWEMSHGAQLASCFHLLSEHFEYGLIGSSDDYSHLTIPWGSSPCIDFLFSTGRLKIVHDGSGYSRTEKVERIGKNEQVKKYLKVCWEKGLEDNCGRCEKCLRTRLNFLAVGIDNPSCFNGKLNFDDFKRIKLKNKGIIEEVEGIIDYVKKNNIQVNWINKIERIIIKNKIRNKIRKIRQSLKS